VDVVSEQKRAQILIWIKHDVKTGLVLWSKAHNPKVSPKFRGRTLSQIWYQVMIGRLVGRELYSIETGFSFKQWSFAGDYTTMHVQLENEAQVQSGCRFDFVVSRDVIQKYHPDADRPSYFHRLAALPQQWFEGLGAEWAACTSGFSLLLDGVFQRYSPREDKLEAAAVKTKDREVPLEADVQLERLSHWLLGAFGNQGQLKTIARLLDQSFYSPVTDGTALRVKDLVNRRGLWSGRYNSRMPVRRTPLAVASYFSNIDIMRTLLDAGADPNIETPLEEVLVGRSDTSKAYKRMNYSGAVALLLERGACPWNMRDDLLIFGQDRYLRQQIDEHSCDKCLNARRPGIPSGASTGQAKMDLRTTSTFPPASELKQHVPSSITFPASGKYVPPHMRLNTASPAPANNNRQPAAAQPQSLARESEPVPGNHRLPDNPRCGCVSITYSDVVLMCLLISCVCVFKEQIVPKHLRLLEIVRSMVIEKEALAAAVVMIVSVRAMVLGIAEAIMIDDMVKE